MNKEAIAEAKELGLILIRAKTIVLKNRKIIFSTSDEYEMASFIHGYYLGYKAGAKRK